MDLTRNNYKAWLVKEADFPSGRSIIDQFKYLLHYAVLAPSAHNIQPWLFKVEPDRIVVYLNKSRTILESDSSSRQIIESIGACLTNIIIAAKHFGFNCDARYTFEQGKEDIVKKEIAHVLLDVGMNRTVLENDILFYCITQRHSAKLEYFDGKLDESIKRAVFEADRVDGVNLHLVEDEEKIKKLADIAAKATVRSFDMPGFRTELSKWVKHNWTKEPDGMPAFTVGIPGPLSLIAPTMLGKLNLGKPQAKMMKKSVLNSSAIGMIAGGGDSQYFWLQTGRLFQEVALRVTALDWGMASMGAPIQFSETRAELRDVAGFGGVPLIFFRLGKPKKEVPYSPRLLADRCIV